jgi:N,N-dimethylformamidase
MPSAERESLRLVGYADRLRARSGDEVTFMVSCEADTYGASIVRLVHGDENPAGPGFKEHVVRELPSLAGRVQTIHPGSAVIVRDAPVLAGDRAWTLLAWIWSTTTGCAQSVMGRWAPEPGGVRLVLGAEGRLQLEFEAGRRRATVSASEPIRRREWYLVAATWDPRTRQASLIQRPARTWPSDPTSASVVGTTDVLPAQLPDEVPFVIGAGGFGPEGEVLLAFDGRIEAPSVVAAALAAQRIEGIARGDRIPLAELSAAWDFGAATASRAPDVSGRSRHGTLFNGPERAVTSHLWDGTVSDFRTDPRQYAALHFHSDDLDDARWAPDFRFRVPDDLPSGVYAARLRSGSDEDHIPFIVRPHVGRPGAPLALLLPTLTYIAYANDHNDEAAPEHRRWKLPTSAPFADTGTWARAHEYIRGNALLSLYDTHADGFGVSTSSRLRPMLNVRPRFRFRQLASPARFSADLYIVDWLEALRYRFDVITDEDLHAEGHELLAPYAAVVTGTHPEYATAPMLNALATYREAGGRIAYLGGNGFYWVTSVDPERPHVIEVRRTGGTGPFEAPPGEHHHATTGEQGGLWRNRAHAPQQLVGVGFSASGSDAGAGYVRHPASHDEAVSWIFEGVAGDAFGDVRSLVLRHGAAGYEMDRADVALGTPPDAVLLATSTDHLPSYRPALEELERAQGWPLSDDLPAPRGVHPIVRADLVYLDRGKGGAFFSTGSIGWAACLSANSYDNAVSRITDNVLRRWLGRTRGGTA